MNDEEKAYLGPLREVIAECGFEDLAINIDFWCGEAWRNHVESVNAKDFFRSALNATGMVRLVPAHSAYRASVVVTAPPEPAKVFKVKKRR